MTNIKSGIYKIENIKNGKVYIGSSKNINKRWDEHIRALNNNKHHSKKLQNSYNKAKDKSVFEFKIVEEVLKDDLLEKEQYYIDLFDSFNKGYNCTKEVNNPKMFLKNISKTEKKKRINFLYHRFTDIYDKFSMYIEIGSALKNRLLDKHYKINTYNNIVNGIEFFVTNYQIPYYRVRLSYSGNILILNVEDYEGNQFACYSVRKNNICISQDDTKIYIDYLKEYKKFDKNKHYLI